MWQETAIPSTHVRHSHNTQTRVPTHTDTHTHTQRAPNTKTDLNFLQGISVLLANNAKDYSGRTDHGAYLQHHYPKSLHLLI